MRAHNSEVRRQAIELWQSGQKKSSISRQLGVDYDTLLGWIKRYEQEGESGLVLRYGQCGRKSKAEGPLRQRALELMQQHREWGAGYLRLQLQREFLGQRVVQVRQLQRWVAQAGIRPKRTKLPPVKVEWASGPLERVQVDAKERLLTQDGVECCYLNFTDEFSGAELDAFVFPLGQDQPSSGTVDF